MLAKFDVKEKKIGENIYYVRALPPFPALSLLGDIQAVLTTALKGTTHREGDSDLLSTTIDFGNFIANMGNNLNGEVLIKFSDRLLNSDYVSVKMKTSSGEYEIIRLSEEVIDRIFTANIMELLKLLYFVLEVNYGDFFRFNAQPLWMPKEPSQRIKIPGTVNPLLMREAIIWRPIMEKVITLEEVKSGVVSLSDLCKICALLDMRIDIQEYHMKHSKH